MRLQAHVRAAPVALGPAAGDQPGLPQHLQVMGDQVGRQAERLADLARCGIAEREGVDYRQTRRIAQCGVDARPRPQR